MWNNYNNQPNPGAGGTPPPFPNYSNPPSFPNAQPGYQPGYAPSYPPPPGPPNSYGPPPGGYPPPPGPPPGGPQQSRFPPTPGYGPPPGPPPGGYPPPPGVPPGYGHPQGGYPPPPGPPPGPPHNKGYPGQQYHQYQQQPGSGYPGQQQHQNSYQAPPPTSYSPSGPPPQRPPADVQRYGPHFQGSNNRDAQPWFQYSQCNGKKKGLFIGINYFGQDGQLQGCINDAQNIQNFLIQKFAYKREDMVTLTDDQTNPRGIPTRSNMVQAMQWLVRGAKANDSLFFHFSGHGGQTKDLDGDEADGYDEVIYPVDFDAAGHITDDDLHDLLVKPLPPGCRLTVIMDCCHSGSGLDLPYMYSTEGKLKEPNLAAEAGQGLLQAATAYARGDMSKVFQSAMGLVKTATGNSQKADKYAKATKTSPADCISFSGCRDNQTSADTQEAGEATGAMSFAFISALNANPQQSYQQLLGSVREILKSKYSQKPQLSSSHPMDTNLLFIC